MTKMENGGVVISGYLFKSPPQNKLRNLRSWTKRYFVLHENKLLFYYKNDKDTTRPVKDPIKLSHCKCIESNLNHEKFKFVFSVVTDQRTYYLVADSQKEMETWVDKLTKVCGFRRTDQHQSSDGNAGRKVNVYNSSPAHPKPIASAKRSTTSPIGTPSSVSSSSSSLTSPTGPCPLSIPKHIMDDRNKQRSVSDPPEHTSDAPQVHRGMLRRQSEQAGIPTSPLNIRDMQGKARLSGVLSEMCDAVPSPRPLHHDEYDNLQSPKKVIQPVFSSGLENNQDNYDDVPIPRPCDSAPNSLSPRRKSGHHLFPPDKYDAVPTPRPLSQASNRSSQDVYDLVPPPRPTSSCSQDDQSIYDVPPSGREQENYDIVPPVHRPVAPKPSHVQSDNLQQNYDVVPLRHPLPQVRDTQSVYDFPPSGRGMLEQENYDIVPPFHRPVAPKPNHIQPGTSQENYDVLPKRQPSMYDVVPSGRALEQENYDIVPPARPVVPKSNHTQQETSQDLYDIVPKRQTTHFMYDGQSAYDNLPSERRSSTQENYDIVPPVHRPVSSKPSHSQPYNPQENYDVVPIPRPAGEDYDIVPPPRAITTANELGSSGEPHSYEVDHRLSDIYSVPPNLQSTGDPHEWVPTPPRPAPYRSQKDAYDPLPNTNRPVSADSGLNASFSSICSLKSEGNDGQEDRYNAPLPALPNTRDSGSLSDDSPDDGNPNDIYDIPPNWESRNSIYDVPPKQESIYDVLPKHSDEIYDRPPMTSDEIYDVPPSHSNQGLASVSPGRPVIDRSTKRPPQVNRANKPKTATTQDHSYCNMPPPVDRDSKHRRGTVPQPEPSYVNFGVPPTRPQNLPLVKTLAGNPFAGSLPNQQDRWSAGLVDDADYCPMEAPTRTEMTRCYSYSKENAPRSRTPDRDQCYEDMSALQTRRYSSGRSNSSSSSSLADNEDMYMPMNPSHHGSSPAQMEQKQRRDLLYAEVEIIEGAQQVRIPYASSPRRENTNYTSINEESTRALLQTCHARQGFR